MDTLIDFNAGNKVFFKIQVERPEWLPVRPAVPTLWIRSLLAKAIRIYLRKQTCCAFDECN
jgi:hypothetical protein